MDGVHVVMFILSASICVHPQPASLVFLAACGRASDPILLILFSEHFGFKRFDLRSRLLPGVRVEARFAARLAQELRVSSGSGS